MNISSKCNCCICEPVCKFKETYQNGIEAILNATFSTDTNLFSSTTSTITKVKDCRHIEVSIRCPHMVTQSMRINGGLTDEL